jgi:putative transposase
MIRRVAGACPAVPARTGYFLVVETQKGPSMRYRDSIFGELLKPISRRWFRSRVDALAADAYAKAFRSWDHLVTLLFAQLSGIDGLRGLETVWNANAHHHYHLGVTPIARSTLSDANARRPVALFADTFAMLSGLAGRTLKREGAEMLRLIDASPIPLDAAIGWAVSNGRTRGLKLHVVYDPDADHPRRIDITPATVNDVTVGTAVAIEAGATYVFDKAYCSYAWWIRLHQAGATFVTRKKDNARYRLTRRRPLEMAQGDGFTLIEDAEVVLASKGDSRLPMPMRRVRVKREGGGILTLITNDLARPAVTIAAAYKTRWQIELLFRWIKQHLKLAKFLGRSDNAVRLQLIAAMIAYLLLRIAARQARLTMPAIRFAQLVREGLFQRKSIARIDKPPELNPTRRQPTGSPNQHQLS